MGTYYMYQPLITIIEVGVMSETGEVEESGKYTTLYRLLASHLLMHDILQGSQMVNVLKKLLISHHFFMIQVIITPILTTRCHLVIIHVDMSDNEFYSNLGQWYLELDERFYGMYVEQLKLLYRKDNDNHFHHQGLNIIDKMTHLKI